MHIISSASGVTVTNNVIARNTMTGTGAAYGSGIFSWDSAPMFVNNTFAYNCAGYGATALYSRGIGPTAPLVRNNIVVGHNIGIESSGDVPPQVDHNDVFGATFADYYNTSPGEGAISADPQFVNAVADDYHIRFGSPAMNVGTNVSAPPYDRDGVIRPQGNRVDMGAYEVVIHSLHLPLTLKNY
jgi:hypothetical protein